ncbi:MAG: hypothetical protein ACXU8U_08750 [Asticcacaulis sp.]
MLWIGLAAILLVIGGVCYWMSGNIETRRTQLKNGGKLSRRQSESHKSMSANIKRVSYGFGFAALVCLWLHVGVGL